MSIVLNDKQLTDNDCQHHYHDDYDDDVDGLIAVHVRGHGHTAVKHAAATAAHAGTAIQNKKTIDADTYNLLAFDQCDGAWPIGHPLPLPMWSNVSKAPLIVDKVSDLLGMFFFSFRMRQNV